MNKDKITVTAKEFHNSPAKPYREADKGNDVVINHDRYPDKVFVLTARERAKGEGNDKDS